jgi:hypothetical protein
MLGQPIGRLDLVKIPVQRISMRVKTRGSMIRTLSILVSRSKDGKIVGKLTR